VIVLAQLIDQWLIKVAHFFEREQHLHPPRNITEITNRLKRHGIDVENDVEWEKIRRIRQFANYLKHGEGSSFSKIKNELENRSGIFATLTPNVAGESLSPLPLVGRYSQVSKEFLAEILETTRTYFKWLAHQTKHCTPGPIE
jgi:hypothetical protein